MAQPETKRDRRGRPPADERAVYVISVAAELAGMHPQTLRIYERRGLVSPKRTAGNSRRYSERDIQRLREIQELTQRVGINLAGVKVIMQMQERLEKMQRRVDRLEGELIDALRTEGSEARNAVSANILPLRSVVVFPWEGDERSPRPRP
jgi:MerR family transcriptional regulator, heat shock protein HspR